MTQYRVHEPRKNLTQVRSIMAEFTKNNTTSADIKGAITVPYLNKDERPMANSLHGSPINVKTTPTSSTPSTKGKFQKVEGLVFDSAFLHFEPTKWKYCISKDVDCIDLELCSERYNGIDNFTTNLLHVHRHRGRDTSMLFQTCARIANTFSGVRCNGWGGVGGMFSAGYNVGYKGRISRVASFAKTKKTGLKSGLAKINNLLFMAGKNFHQEFSEMNVGYDEMLQVQEKLWPKNRNYPNGPASWIVSKNLGNPEHIDNDLSRSYAGWFTNGDIANESAWFLFPNWGVAIELCNDTWISWAGNECAHCSSIPHLTDEVEIYSLFTAITKKVSTTADRVKKCEAILQESKMDFMSLTINDRVTLRWVQQLTSKDKLKLSKQAVRKYGNKNRRWLHCAVLKIDHQNGTVQLRERLKNKRGIHTLSKCEVANRLVPGWV